MKLFIYTIFFVSMTLFVTSCSSLQSSNQEEPLQKYNPNFRFNPTTEPAKTGSAEITIALQRPAYLKDNITLSSGTNVGVNIKSDPFPQFANGLEQAIDNVLLNKGMLVKGPYDMFDEIVYSEKREIDLYLVPEIDLTANTNGLTVYRDEKISILNGTSNVYFVQGTMSFGGNVYMRMESENGTLLWKKQLPLENTSIQVKSQKTWNESYAASSQYMTDTAIYNEVSKQLEKYFNSSTKLMETYISVQEFKDLKTQLEEDMGI